MELEDIPEHLTAKVLLSSPDYLSSFVSASAPNTSTQQSQCSVARCIAIIDRPLVFTPTGADEEEPPATEVDYTEEGAEEPPERPAPPNYEVDTALLVFPPASLGKGSSTAAAHVLVVGESSMSTPRGKCKSECDTAKMKH